MGFFSYFIIPIFFLIFYGTDSLEKERIENEISLEKERIEDEVYIAKIDGLILELKKNILINNNILGGRDPYLMGEMLPTSKYYTFNINERIKNSDIRNETIMNITQNVAHRMLKSNRLLDLSASVFYSTQLINDPIIKRNANFRVIETMEFIIEDADYLDIYIPYLIGLLEDYKQNIH